MKPRKPSPEDLLAHCDSIEPDDGVDPRLYFGGDAGRRRRGRSEARLARTVEQTLHLSLASLDVEVVAVRVDRSRAVATVRPRPGDDVREVKKKLERAAPAVRCELAAALRRRRVPDLVFEVAPPEPGGTP